MMSKALLLTLVGVVVLGSAMGNLVEKSSFQPPFETYDTAGAHSTAARAALAAFPHACPRRSARHSQLDLRWFCAREPALCAPDA